MTHQSLLIVDPKDLDRVLYIAKQTLKNVEIVTNDPAVQELREVVERLSQAKIMRTDLIEGNKSHPITSFEWRPRKWPEEKPEDEGIEKGELILVCDPQRKVWRSITAGAVGHDYQWHPMPPVPPKPFVPEQGVVYHHPEQPAPNGTLFHWWDKDHWCCWHDSPHNQSFKWCLQPPAPEET